MDQDVERGRDAPTGQDVVTDQGFGTTNPSMDTSVPATPPPGASAATTSSTTGGGSPPSAEPGAGGLGALISGLMTDLQGLLRGEVRLATTELKEEATAAAGGAATVAAGGVAGLVGVVFLMHGVADLLSRIMPRWAANTLVGLGLLAGAGSLGLSGKEKLSAAKLAPQQTLQTLRENTAWAKERLASATGQSGGGR